MAVDNEKHTINVKSEQVYRGIRRTDNKRKIERYFKHGTTDDETNLTRRQIEDKEVQTLKSASKIK